MYSRFRRTISVDVDIDDILDECDDDELLEHCSESAIRNYMINNCSESDLSNPVAACNTLGEFLKNWYGRNAIVTKEDMLKNVTELINDNYYLMSRY